MENTIKEQQSAKQLSSSTTRSLEPSHMNGFSARQHEFLCPGRWYLQSWESWEVVWWKMWRTCLNATWNDPNGKEWKGTKKVDWKEDKGWINPTSFWKSLKFFFVRFFSVEKSDIKSVESISLVINQFKLYPPFSCLLFLPSRWQNWWCLRWVHFVATA